MTFHKSTQHRKLHAHQEQVLLEGRKMNLCDIHRSSSRLLTPVKLGCSLQTVTRAMIHQSLDDNQINKLSEHYILKNELG